MNLVIRLLLPLAPLVAMAQGTLADYQRARGLHDKLQGLAVNVAGPANWIDDTDRFWFRKSVKGGHEFVVVDADRLTRRPAFDHEKLAAALSSVSGEKYDSLKLPFAEITFVDKQQAIQFAIATSMWKCSLDDYVCAKSGVIPQGPAFNRSPMGDDSQT